MNEIIDRFTDPDRPGPCGTFWRDRTRCPVKRGSLYDGGHVCRVPCTLKHDDHECGCGHVWILRAAIQELSDGMGSA